MRTWKKTCAGLALFAGLTPALFAQAPAIPGAPPGAAGAAAAAAPQAAAGPNIFNMLCIPEDKIAKCKDCVCKIPLLRGMINGVGGVAGMAGLMPGPICPDPILEAAKGKDAAAAAQGDAAAAAAKIKAIEADAKARRAALRYLGTVDCRYFPEAEEALVVGLRRDPIECVRWEAAMALGNGCCCTKKVMQALVDALSSNPKDGAPPESSERVRAAAHAALNGCLARYQEVVPAKKVDKGPEGDDKKPPEGKPLPPVARQTGRVDRAAYYERVEQKSMQELVNEARRTLVEASEAATMTPVNAAPSSGNRGLFQLMSSSRSGRSAASSSSPSTTVVPAGSVPQVESAPVESRAVAPAPMHEPCVDDCGMDPLPRLIHKIRSKSQATRPVQRNNRAPAHHEVPATPTQAEPVRQQGSSQGVLPTLSNRLSARQTAPKQNMTYPVPAGAQAAPSRETRTVVTREAPVAQPLAPVAQPVTRASHTYASPSREAAVFGDNVVVVEADPTPDEESFAADREEEAKQPSGDSSRRLKLKPPWSK